MPTVITDTPAVLAQAVGAAIAARGLHGFAGLHIEGPHIAPARRGTHAAEYIRPLDDVTFTHLRALRAADVAVMLTLAPEMVSPDQIRALATLGVVVALGHSDATAAVARDAFAAGARAVTHLFNAMSQMQGRAPGLTGAAILGDAHVGVICDGVHVADQMLALAHRARPLAGRMFLVSDAMPTVGGPDRFTLYGHEIRLRDGRLINADGALAGAHTTMQAGVQRLVGQVGLTVQDALQMAVSAPAALIGAPLLGQVSGRRVDDLLVLDAALAVQGTLAQLMP